MGVANSCKYYQQKHEIGIGVIMGIAYVVWRVWDMQVRFVCCKCFADAAGIEGLAHIYGLD